jgi:hypothetical protein
MFRWWRKRKKEVSSVMAYNHAEISAVFNRLGGCFGCSHWMSDGVKARVGRFLVDTWDGKNPTPPTLADLQQFCCRAERSDNTVTIDTTKIGGGQVVPGDPLPR